MIVDFSAPPSSQLLKSAQKKMALKDKFILNKEGETVHYQPTVFEGIVEDLTQQLRHYIE